MTPTDSQKASTYYRAQEWHPTAGSPSWRNTDFIFRSEENAQRYVDARNAELLEAANTAWRERHRQLVREYREHQALLAAGLRGSAGPRDPGEYKPLEKLEPGMRRYRVAELEFVDG